MAYYYGEKLVIAVDFDGTLCENKYPKIGKPKWDIIKWVQDRYLDGHTLILWTCREGKHLEEADEWLESVGIRYMFSSYNENLPERIEQFGNNPRKIGADIYLDDKAMSLYDITH